MIIANEKKHEPTDVPWVATGEDLRLTWRRALA
jgi:hypothetical protein